MAQRGLSCVVINAIAAAKPKERKVRISVVYPRPYSASRRTAGLKGRSAALATIMNDSFGPKVTLAGSAHQRNIAVADTMSEVSRRTGIVHKPPNLPRELPFVRGRRGRARPEGRDDSVRSPQGRWRRAGYCRSIISGAGICPQSYIVIHRRYGFVCANPEVIWEIRAEEP